MRRRILAGVLAAALMLTTPGATSSAFAQNVTEHNRSDNRSINRRY